MIKIYLDQKDYIRIARTISGDSDFKEDLFVYGKLKQQVNENKIRIYFSINHLIEAFKYDPSGGENFKIYTEVIDNLTNGHCLRHPYEILKVELLRYLKDNFGIDISLTIDDQYPYGQGIDCVIKDYNPFRNLRIKVIEDIKNALRKDSKSNSKAKKSFIKKLDNPRLRNRIIKRNVSQKELQDLKSDIPALRGLRLHEYHELLVGNKKERIKVENKINKLLFRFENLYHFKNHLNLQKLGSFSDSSDLIKAINILKVANQKYGDRFGENEYIKMLEERFYKDILDTKSELIKYVQNKEIDLDKYISSINQDEIKNVSSLKKALKLYFKQHIGLKSRKPHKNDYIDIQNLRYVSYVDCYVTEKYFEGIARNVGKEYKTKTFKNLNELYEVLENTL